MLERTDSVLLGMSATNRGAERVEADFYPTPEYSFKPLLRYLPRGGQVWEPAWGDRRLVKWMLEAGIDAWGADLNEPEEENRVDFLKDKTLRYCTLTNPPFSLAFQFVQHACAISEHVFMLLRLPFLASDERVEWFRQHEPSALLVLSKRPSFVMSVKCAKKCGYQETLPLTTARPKKCPACGGAVKISTTDNSDYAWFYWYQGWEIAPYRGIYHL